MPLQQGQHDTSHYAVAGFPRSGLIHYPISTRLVAIPPPDGHTLDHYSCDSKTYFWFCFFGINLTMAINSVWIVMLVIISLWCYCPGPTGEVQTQSKIVNLKYRKMMNRGRGIKNLILWIKWKVKWCIRYLLCVIYISFSFWYFWNFIYSLCDH